MSYEYIFVLVVYRNYNDLTPYLESLKTKFTNYKVIIVNNYYDDLSSKAIKEISLKYDTVFIESENKGYGTGNNIGIKYAMENYKFSYLIVSNTDIDIKQFDGALLKKYDDCLYAPYIKTAGKKHQNPYWSSDFNFGQKQIYIGMKKNSKFHLYLGYGINKLRRELYLITTSLTFRKYRKCFGSHGAFVIFTYKALERLGLPYDENMFLFNEEAHLAHLCKEKKIKTYYVPSIKVIHQEDASMGSVNVNNEEKKSYTYFYEKYHKVKGE